MKTLLKNSTRTKRLIFTSEYTSASMCVCDHKSAERAKKLFADHFPSFEYSYCSAASCRPGVVTISCKPLSRGPTTPGDGVGADQSAGGQAPAQMGLSESGIGNLASRIAADFAFLLALSPYQHEAHGPSGPLGLLGADAVARRPRRAVVCGLGLGQRRGVSNIA